MAGNVLASLLLMIQTKGDVSGLTKTDRALRKTSNTLKNLKKDTGFLSKLGGKIGGAFGGMGFLNMAGNYLQFEKDLGAIHSRFFAITKDQKQAREEFDFVRKLATDTAMDIKSTADAYSIFYGSAQKAMGTEGTRQVMTDWAKVGRVLHLSEYQMERVTYALREMVSKGAIYSQDLRMQIGTHVPDAMGLAQKAAEQMGITGSDWFDTLQKKAKSNAKITTEFVRLFSSEARKAFGSESAFKEAMKQPDALANQIKNTMWNIGYNFSQAGGGYMVVKVLEGVAEAMKDIPFDKITSMLGNMAKVIGDLAMYIPILLTLVKNLAIFMIGLKVLRGVGSIAGGLYNFSKFVKSIGSLHPAILAHLIKRLALFLIDTPKRLFFRLSRFFLGTAWRSALVAGLNLVPGIGTLLSIGLAIWTIAELVHGILDLNKEKKLKELENNELGKMLSSYGLTPLQFVQLLDKLESAPELLKKPTELAKQMNYTKGEEKIADMLYIDNGKIYITVNGETSPDEVRNWANTIEDIKDKKKSKMGFNKPMQGKIQKVEDLFK